MHIGGESVYVNHLARGIRDSVRAIETGVIVYEWWIEARIQGVRLRDSIVGHTKSTANHEPIAKLMVAKFARAPREAELRTEIGFLRVELAAASPDVYPRELVGALAKIHSSQQVVFFRNRTKIFPAQPCSHSQVRPQLVVVLEEQPDDVVAKVLPKRRRNTCLGISLHAFVFRRVIQKVPDVVERKTWTIRPEWRVNREQTGKFASHLHGVGTLYLGQNVLGRIGPLVEAIERTDAVPLDADAAHTANGDLRQAKRRVGVARKVLVKPTSSIYASLIH